MKAFDQDRGTRGDNQVADRSKRHGGASSIRKVERNKTSSSRNTGRRGLRKRDITRGGKKERGSKSACKKGTYRGRESWGGAEEGSKKQYKRRGEKGKRHIGTGETASGGPVSKEERERRCGNQQGQQGPESAHITLRQINAIGPLH